MKFGVEVGVQAQVLVIAKNQMAKSMENQTEAGIHIEVYGGEGCRAIGKMVLHIHRHSSRIVLLSQEYK